MVCALIDRVDGEEDGRMLAVDLADGFLDEVRTLVLHLLVLPAL